MQDIRKDIRYILIILIAITATYRITRYYFENEPLPLNPQPIIQYVPVKAEIPEIKGKAKITKAKMPVVPSVEDSTDFYSEEPKDSSLVEIAELDTTITYKNEFSYKDTTFTATDTLKLKLKYVGDPLNYFEVNPELTTTRFIYTEDKYKPYYIRPKEGFFDRFKLGIGIGYGTHLQETNFKPTVFIGVIYTLKMPF